MSPDRAYLDDILHSARLASSYIAGLTFDQFEVDTKTQDAVIRRRLTPAVTGAMPGIDWRRIADMRNLMIHRYWDVDLTIVWSTAGDDLPPLIHAIEEYQTS